MLCWRRWRANRRRSWRGARPSDRRRFVVPTGRAAACDLPIQACPCSGRAYGTLLREPRRALHARIAETIESHSLRLPRTSLSFWRVTAQRLDCREGCASVGQSGTAVAGAVGVGRSCGTAHPCPCSDRGLARHAGASARRDQLQVAVITPLMLTKGHAAPETKAATEHARLLIERAEALERPQKTHCCCSPSSTVSGSRLCRVQRRRTSRACGSIPRARRNARSDGPAHGRPSSRGYFVLVYGGFAQCRAHYDMAISLYSPLEHRPLASRFGQDVRVATLTLRSLALWVPAIPRARSRMPSTRSRTHARLVTLPR